MTAVLHRPRLQTVDAVVGVALFARPNLAAAVNISALGAGSKITADATNTSTTDTTTDTTTCAIESTTVAHPADATTDAARTSPADSTTYAARTSPADATTDTTTDATRTSPTDATYPAAATERRRRTCTHASNAAADPCRPASEADGRARDWHSNVFTETPRICQLLAINVAFTDDDAHRQELLRLVDGGRLSVRGKGTRDNWRVHRGQSRH
mmetsp:Transcript_8289/g.23022  ORF Transcript_8289/g.23022 Transcript_8289/m.23022 type:complete len:213 (+) Transcript_8289:395-1033(+)